MQKRRLGQTGLEVTVVGFGGAPVGRIRTSRVGGLRTVWAALEAGVDLIDSSPHYGLGRSEIVIGQALRERPELAKSCVVSTKTGHYQGTKHHTYELTKRSIELSLQRLRRDYLDIVHLHDLHSEEEWWRAMRPSGSHRALRELKAQGVIGAIGIGTRSLQVLDLAVGSGAFDVMMIANQYNLLTQAGADVIRKASERGMGVIIAGALATGILAKGSANPDSRYQYRPPSDGVRAQVARIEALCARWACTLPGAAVHYCLRGPASEAVMVLGARTAQQAQTNVAAAEEGIQEGFWEELDKVIGTSLAADLD